MISSKWLVVLWSAFYAGHCFKQSCLNGESLCNSYNILMHSCLFFLMLHIAPSYADEELSVVTCNSTHALLAWSLGLHTQGLSSLAFEYSCLNVTDDGLIPVSQAAHKYQCMCIFHAYTYYAYACALRHADCKEPISTLAYR